MNQRKEKKREKLTRIGDWPYRPSRATHLVEPTFCFSCQQFTAFRKGNISKVGSPSRARLGSLFKYISFCFILLFPSSSPCRKDLFAVSNFSTSLIVLIQVYNWEIRHHSFVCCCGLADILYILELSHRLVTVLAGTAFLPINGAKPAFICSWIALVFHEAQSVREAEFNGPIQLLPLPLPFCGKGNLNIKENGTSWRHSYLWWKCNLSRSNCSSFIRPIFNMVLMKAEKLQPRTLKKVSLCLTNGNLVKSPIGGPFLWS